MVPRALPRVFSDLPFAIGDWEWSCGCLAPLPSLPRRGSVAGCAEANCVRSAVTVAWLTAAFGFVERLRIGENHRSQLRVGDGAVIVAEPGGYHCPPSREAVGQYVMVRVPDARSHCERARAHGAVILAEP